MKIINAALLIISLCLLTGLGACSDDEYTNGELVAKELQKIFKDHKIEQIVCVSNEEQIRFKKNVSISIENTFLYIGDDKYVYDLYKYAYNLDKLIRYYITEENGASRTLTIYLYFM